MEVGPQEGIWMRSSVDEIKEYDSDFILSTQNI